MLHGARRVELRMNDFAKVIAAFRELGWRAPAHVFRAMRHRNERRRIAAMLASEAHLETKFSLIHQTRWWDEHGESVSGPGSSIAFTSEFRRSFEAFLSERRVNVLFDAPCGDWNWMKDVVLSAGMRYVGGDIVPELVANLAKTYGNAKTEFRRFDVTRDPFPVADLWLCRDCLIHLSNEDVRQALKNFCESSVPFALISNYVNREPNRDIVSGDFRPLDLTKAPFLLPQPILTINDWPGAPDVRHVCLWGREQVSAALGLH